MAPERRIRRFSRTERALHWAHASAFLVLLGSGLVLYVPRLSELVARRQLVKDVHLYTGLAWAVLITLLLLLGIRHGLRETIRELERFDREDLRWLLRRGDGAGRFNAGQKLNAIVTGAFAVLFAISGFLLWYGERDTRFRFANTILLHDGLMYVALVLLAGPPLDQARPVGDHPRLGRRGVGAPPPSALGGAIRRCGRAGGRRRRRTRTARRTRPACHAR
jgi:formate dehydrogenase subunit gamma